MFNTININLIYMILHTSFTIVIYFFQVIKANRIFWHLRRKLFKMATILK